MYTFRVTAAHDDTPPAACARLRQRPVLASTSGLCSPPPAACARLRQRPVLASASALCLALVAGSQLTVAQEPVARTAGPVGDELADTGWRPDDTRRADGSLGPRSSVRGFRLPIQGTFGWQRHAVRHVKIACREKRLPLHADCGEADMYQFGVYTGRSLKGTTRALRAQGVAYRTFWGLDSFQGLPNEHKSELRSTHSSAEWQQGTFNAADMFKTHSYSALISKISAYVDDPHVEFVRGYYNESCTAELAVRMRPALFVDIDVDLYISTVQAMSFLLENKLLVVGSLVGYDDWPAGGRAGGEQRAHREITRKFGLQWRNIVPHCKESAKGQCVFELLAVGHSNPDCDCIPP